MAYGIVYSMQIPRVNGRSELDLKYNYSSRSSYIYREYTWEKWSEISNILHDV